MPEEGTEEGNLLSKMSTAADSAAPSAEMGKPQNRELTFGEKAVGLNFNPANDPTVQKVKELYAEIIDLCNDARSVAGQGERGRLFSVAITEAQTAQMWAVKAVTWK